MKTVLLVSPREPSGATWLINCLLALGVKTYRHSPLGMWHRDGGVWRLAEHEDLLKKWLPVLSEEEAFTFRDDIEVRWTHEWPDDRSLNDQILFFVRDPRDSLFSRFKREAGAGDYAEFLESPDHLTLLKRPENWSLFCESWLAGKSVNVFRFEDYKADALGTLFQVVEALGLHATPELVSQAVERSTFEKAADAERLYRLANPDDVQRINRAGAVGSWGGEGVDRAVVSAIEGAAGLTMERLGYGLSGDAGPQQMSYKPNVDELPLFRSVPLPRNLLGTIAGSKEEGCRLAWLADFAKRISIPDLRAAGYSLSECRMLMEGLFVLLEGRRPDICVGLRELYQVQFPQTPSGPRRGRLMRALFDRMRRGLAK
ncbi:sulfotransferase domain-containing protein [Pelagibius sp. CAU 1746]|uniref:sulfotransferase domain-containing protein n=1 Tax=Pelagibius sp. CAU 1746 TaxID=3140370 RepID=UPI00325AD6E5